MIVIHAVFWKFEYPCETGLPGSMGDPILTEFPDLCFNSEKKGELKGNIHLHPARTEVNLYEKITLPLSHHNLRP